MRCFLGFDLPPKTKLDIEHWREKALPAFAKPVSPANYHITLAFLGQVTPKDLDQIETQLQHFDDPYVSINPSKRKKYEVSLNSLGFWAKPKILFLGTTKPHGVLTDLAESLSTLMLQIGIPIERREYIPHVTLVRGVKANPPCALFEPDIDITFDRFHLFESESTQTGVRYVIRKTWYL